MIVNIKNKEYELIYTYNSFKHMTDFDISELQEIAKKPFKLITILEDMLYGAVNNDPKRIVQRKDVSALVESLFDGDGDIGEIFDELSTQLEKSGFFKYLQRK